MRYELAMTDGAVMRGKCNIISCLLQMQILEQLHSNHLGTEKTHMLTRESVYWISMNTDIEQTMKQCSTYPEYHYTQLC